MTDVLDRLRSALADRYTIEPELGRGGMAVVYLAHDRKHDRHVAIKVLRPELAASLGGERFLREIQIAAKLNHPHILPLHDSGEADGYLFYVMPFVEGESLRDRLTRERQLPIDDALQITKEVADALGYAHSLGLVHRDIKPENILFQGGHAVVSDFGIARAVSEAGAATLTETGLAVGTPAYMSPEQASGSKDIDARSDLYSLGCVLYEMLAGEPPYTGPTAQAMMARKLSEPLPRISVIREAVPPAVEEALAKALAKTPADRFATAGRFAEALEASTVLRQKPARARRARLMALTGLASVSVIAAVIWITMPSPAPALDPELVAVLPFRTVGLPEGYQHVGTGVVDLADQLSTGEGGPRTVHSSAVRERWQDAGGAVGRDLTEEHAIEVATALGAGRLLTGSLLGAGDSVVVVATLTDVGDRTARQQVRIGGAMTDVVALIDQMFVQLLALDAGLDRRSLPSLTTTDFEALRAYLEGRDHFFLGEGGAAVEHFAAAITLDSTFALAGVWYAIAALWVNTEGARRGEAIAEAHRDRLSTADQLILEALSGSLADLEEAVRWLPDRPEAWFLYGDHLAHMGRLMGIADAFERADDAFDNVRWLVPTAAASSYVVWHPLEHAALARDTSRYRELWEPFKAGADSVPFFWRWRAATVFGDTARLSAWRDSMPTWSDMSLRQTAYWARNAEIGFEDALAALEVRRARGVEAADWELYGLLTELGRPSAAAEYARPSVRQGTPVSFLGEVIWWALVADGDTVLAQRAAAHLGRVRDEPPPTGERAVNDRFRNNCALGLWQARNGKNTEARWTLAAMRADGRESTEGMRRVCEGMVESQLGTAGQPQEVLREVDSLMIAESEGNLQSWWTFLNMVLAGLLEDRGEYERALSAVQRESTGLGNWWLFSAARHRQVGRLALLVGDTTRAVDAFERYLRFRYAPEPRLQAEADEVKAQLAGLVAR